jgi:ribosome modulation factor
MFNQYKQDKKNFIKAGASAFSARIPYYNNPYNINPFRSLWIRGWKAAEKEFFEMVKRSKAIQETLPLDEVDA